MRELRNRVERAVNLAIGPWLMPADIFPELRNAVIDAVEVDFDPPACSSP